MALSNSYFQFKQFTIWQQHCAQKVSTDACIFGAWVPVLPSVRTALDIGTGTGLLAHILAAQFPDIRVDAIDLDPQTYDLIVCNPPFFNNGLLGPDFTKNMARHTISLTYSELLLACQKRLAIRGYVCILLPYAEFLLFFQLAKGMGWFMGRQMHIRHTEAKAVTRVVFALHREWVQEEVTQLVIKENSGAYTPEFCKLLKPYYLHL
ncbi:MAG: hypothetical protein EBZ77_10485 [Chitinophagia bacterium]|nr:hypothetical protein [Chitinophagia bacterium]